jgi:hypothetical protein
MMLLFGKARLRTEAEFRHLLGLSGLAVTHRIETKSPNSVIEGSLRG